MKCVAFPYTTHGDANTRFIGRPSSSNISRGSVASRLRGGILIMTLLQIFCRV